MQSIAKDKGTVSDEIFEPLFQELSDKEIVTLVAFAGMMIATNVFNNVLQTEIDEYLLPFQSDKILNAQEHSK